MIIHEHNFISKILVASIDNEWSVFSFLLEMTSVTTIKGISVWQFIYVSQLITVSLYNKCYRLEIYCRVIIYKTFFFFSWVLDLIKSISNSLATFGWDTWSSGSFCAQSVSGLRLDKLQGVLPSVETLLNGSIVAKSVSALTLDKLQGILLSVAFF